MWSGSRGKRLKLLVPRETIQRLEIRSEYEGLSVEAYAVHLLTAAAGRHQSRGLDTSLAELVPGPTDAAAAAAVPGAGDGPDGGGGTPSSGPPVRLRLYVGGATALSRGATQTIERLCQEELAGRGELQIIDVNQQPELAVRDRIIAVPTLIRESPAPERRMTGDLSDRGRIVSELGLDTAGGGQHV